MNAKMFITLIINVVINTLGKKNTLQNSSPQDFKNMGTSSEYIISFVTLGKSLYLALHNCMFVLSTE